MEIEIEIKKLRSLYHALVSNRTNPFLVVLVKQPVRSIGTPIMDSMGHWFHDPQKRTTNQDFEHKLLHPNFPVEPFKPAKNSIPWKIPTTWITFLGGFHAASEI